MPRRWALITLLAAPLGGGCAHLAQKLGPPVIESSLASLADNTELLEDTLRSPEVVASARELGAAITHGALDATATRSPDVDRELRDLVDAISLRLGEQFDAEIAPRVRQT